ncbi:MAG: SHOCT domain-containing protein [Candidatus Dormibacteria bacterium]
MGFGHVVVGGPGYGGDTALGWFHLILGFVIWVLVILVIVWGVRELFRHFSTMHHAGPPLSPAVTELEMLYARGEISREEFLTRRADLAGWVPPGASPPAV